MHTLPVFAASLQLTVASATALRAARASADMTANAAASGLPDTWKAGNKWQFDIFEPISVPENKDTPLKIEADIWDIDLWHASKNPETVKRLHDRKKTVICYFNFGAIQPEDCDFKDWLGADSSWPGTWYNVASPGQLYCEKYQDTKSDKFLALMKKRIDTAAIAGCDGVDPDNIDLYNIEALNMTTNDTITLLKKVADYAHKKTTTLGNFLMIGQKNAPAIASELSKFMDFAVLENCLIEKDGEKPFCDKFQPYLDFTPKKPVIDIEYPHSLANDNDENFGCNLDGINAEDKTKFCSGGGNKTPKDMSQILKLDANGFGLNACTQYCDSKAGLIDVDSNGAQKACSFSFSGCTKGTELANNCCCKDLPKGDQPAKCTSADARSLFGIPMSFSV